MTASGLFDATRAKLQGLVMFRHPDRLPRRPHLSFMAWPVLGPLLCTGVALAYNAIAFQGMSSEAFSAAMRSAVVLPIMLGLPCFAALGLRLKELSAANQKLGVVAATDSLTGCLNRGAFTERVELFLEHQDPGERCGGALLVIDADHFKSINDRFGHDRGDDALVLIAQAIKAVLRETDAVGRIGGEEFAVFLPNADQRSAEMVAERIRRAISLSIFAPGGELRPLSVSIGGAAFEGDIAFHDLFHLADRRLYEAKQFGRNRAEIGPGPIARHPQRAG